MEIRKAKVSDFNMLLEIYSIAREYMKESGNENQWGDSYPEESVINKDIEDGISYVLEKDGRVFACFAFFTGYEKNYELKFASDKEYGIIHSVASDGSEKGVVRQIISFLRKKNETLRIDTHEDNKTMQRALEKLGFKRLGIVRQDDGSERILYELHSNRSSTA